MLSTQAVLQQEMQSEARSAKRHRDAAFRAAPAPAHRPPRPPRPSRQPLTAAQTPDLALRSRSVARAAFDAAVAEKERRAEVCRLLVLHETISTTLSLGLRGLGFRI